ncbi:hypothetical protein, partial [Novacetimonas pomaceti]|uniref:hypothetical protein n=1 Tax=Novacetimonas pomaceti TaxID=2021998 RepID=UPI001980EE91
NPTQKLPFPTRTPEKKSKKEGEASASPPSRPASNIQGSVPVNNMPVNRQVIVRRRNLHRLAIMNVSNVNRQANGTLDGPACAMK